MANLVFLKKDKHRASNLDGVIETVEKDFSIEISNFYANRHAVFEFGFNDDMFISSYNNTAALGKVDLKIINRILDEKANIVFIGITELSDSMNMRNFFTSQTEQQLLQRLDYYYISETGKLVTLTNKEIDTKQDNFSFMPICYFNRVKNKGKDNVLCCTYDSDIADVGEYNDKLCDVELQDVESLDDLTQIPSPNYFVYLEEHLKDFHEEFVSLKLISDGVEAFEDIIIPNGNRLSFQLFKDEYAKLLQIDPKMIKCNKKFVLKDNVLDIIEDMDSNTVLSIELRIVENFDSMNFRKKFLVIGG